MNEITPLTPAQMDALEHSWDANLITPEQWLATVRDRERQRDFANKERDQFRSAIGESSPAATILLDQWGVARRALRSAERECNRLQHKCAGLNRSLMEHLRAAETAGFTLSVGRDGYKYSHQPNTVVELQRLRADDAETERDELERRLEQEASDHNSIQVQTEHTLHAVQVERDELQLHNDSLLIGLRTLEAMLGTLDHSEAVEENQLFETVEAKTRALYFRCHDLQKQNDNLQRQVDEIRAVIDPESTQTERDEMGHGEFVAQAKDGAHALDKLAGIEDLERQLADDSPGTPLGIINAIFEFAEKECGHKSTSAKHAASTLMEWVLDAKRQLTEARKDTEQLIWLFHADAYIVYSQDGDDCWLHFCHDRHDEERPAWNQEGKYSSPREAIDAARENKRHTHNYDSLRIRDDDGSIFSVCLVCGDRRYEKKPQ